MLSGATATEFWSELRRAGTRVRTYSSASTGSPLRGSIQRSDSSTSRLYPSGSLRSAPAAKRRRPVPSGWPGTAASASSRNAVAAAGSERRAATMPAQIAASARAAGSAPARAASSAAAAAVAAAA